MTGTLNWKNLDALKAFSDLKQVKPVVLKEVMSGEEGAQRVKSCAAPMAEGLSFNYAARPVNAEILEVLCRLAKEAELPEKFWIFVAIQLIEMLHGIAQLFGTTFQQ